MSSLRKCFSNLREYAGVAQKYFLVKDKNTLATIEKIPAYDIVRACNILMSKDSDGSIGFKNDDLFHHDTSNGSLAIPNLLVYHTDMSTSVDGVDFQDTVVEIPNEYLGNSNNLINIRHQEGGEISIGGGSNKLVDTKGVVDGLNIYSIGGGIKFPDWDQYFIIDDYLTNSDYPCEPNNENLSTDIECDICESRAQRHRSWEMFRMADCQRHMWSQCEWETETNEDPAEGESNMVKFYFTLKQANVDNGGASGHFIQWTATADYESATDEGCQASLVRAMQNNDTIASWAFTVFNDKSTPPFAGTLIDSQTIFYYNTQDLETAPDFNWPNEADYEFLCDGEKDEYETMDCKNPGPYSLGQGITILFDDNWPHDTYCWDRQKLNEVESYNECKESCEDGTPGPISRHWRYSSRNMGCENPSTVRVDLAYECDCGGDYITIDKNEDMSCGWKALMNDSS